MWSFGSDLISSSLQKLKAAKAQLSEAKGKAELPPKKDAPAPKKEKVGFFGRRKEKKAKK